MAHTRSLACGLATLALLAAGVGPAVADHNTTHVDEEESKDVGNRELSVQTDCHGRNTTMEANASQCDASVATEREPGCLTQSLGYCIELF